jgi:hypothetical protein
MTQGALPLDYEESRLLAMFEAHRGKEIAAADQVLHPRRNLPLETYLEMVEDLRIIRMECSDKRLAIEAYLTKKQKLGFASSSKYV